MFLRDQVRKKGINERVFTANNHYLTHVCHITEMLGPMKASSTRSTERVIKKFSNLIAAKTKTGINATNLLLKLTNYNSNLIKQLEEDTRRLDMADNYDSTYISHPSGCKGAPQLWEPVKKEEEYIGSDNRGICHGVPGSQVESALKSYYSRLPNNVSNVIENRKIRLYFRLWLDSTVYSSSLYRSRRNLTSRAGHYVMFIASRYGSVRHQDVWFVSEVLCYFTHLHCGVTRFLAIGKLFMNKPGDSMDEFGVPVVGSYKDGDRYAVFDVEDILYNVGLVNYKDNNEGTYKVIWPYAVFGEKLDKRKPGKLSDILGLPM